MHSPGDTSPDRKSGCGLFSAVFGRRNLWQRRSISSPPSPTSNVNHVNQNGKSSLSDLLNSKRRRGPSDDADLVATNPPIRVVIQNQQRKHHHHHINETSKVTPVTTQGHHTRQGRKVLKEAMGISGELESYITDHQKSKGSSMLVRASSSNVMLFGDLGNLRQGGGGGNNTNSYNVMDQLPKPKDEIFTANGNGRYTMKHVTENNAANKTKENTKEEGVSLCRAISTRMDPEQLKIMGNEDYKNGRFTEALALYDAAIAIDSNKASYRSNRSAALTALGRLIEAVFECREAIRIEPHYHRAHHRLGSLYLRLGETDKAQYHFKHAGPDTDPDEIAKVRNLQVHLNKCTEARRLRDWNTVRKETNCAISCGANSAPQIFSLQAEALLKLHKHQDAVEVISNGPNFTDEELGKFFGPIGFANLLVTRAQVDMAAGRFDDALEVARRAVKLDSNNKEAGMVMRRARAVAEARSHGNELFRACRFSEALTAYGEGLEHEPCNSVLLCNRAACLSKLGQFERALEDCTSALNLRPSYSKARLRRADCNTKLERWEASVQDYEILLRETPEDEEVRKALMEVQKQLKKQRGEELLL
ncbi:TPR repeat-containing thioredoxin TTL1-like [Prosopis cineraria]|uniref:TPR repeat-containing thioredoxin TTL1-like n=1 Tax=Prosopis cineraria TaxID=364024 RepID=UPI0024104611|nr:TPR repeat-containing thioredoxin TTL1-like [Prosopis cineraria]